ncbi:MAG: MotA/TolQ/ExbB proton channel family protein [Thauera sp.]|jgi:biopolymer transport protein ExbB/TolQ|nr:MotA/TolQ/ExbB proton channel family protein [Thauera sp.]
MNVFQIENLMAEVSQVLMLPVLVLIMALFVYAIYAAGQFCSLYFARKKNAQAYRQSLAAGLVQRMTGYPLHNFFVANPRSCEDELEIAALKQLETLRMVTRIAPMLGLIATMIPMGPALRALADGNVQGISENLIIAFAAVIWGLAIASLTFWPASVKKRWLATELINIRKLRQGE